MSDDRPKRDTMSDVYWGSHGLQHVGDCRSAKAGESRSGTAVQGLL